VTDAGLRCSECGEPFVKDGPCPKCGLTSRLTARSPMPVEFVSTVEAQATLLMEVIRSYPRELMRLARRLIDEHDEYNLASRLSWPIWLARSRPSGRYRKH
jgi:hypothetical protein